MSASGRYRRPPPPAPAFYGGPERRRDDPQARLARRLDDTCVNASGPLEIAVVLETLGDGALAPLSRAGDPPDVFELAWALYRLCEPARQRGLTSPAALHRENHDTDCPPAEPGAARLQLPIRSRRPHGSGGPG